MRVNITKPFHPEAPKLLLSGDEAARVCGVSRRTIFNWAKAGLLTPIKLGRRTVRFKLSDVEAFIEGGDLSRVAQSA